MEIDILGTTRGVVCCSSGINACVHCYSTHFDGKRVVVRVWVQISME